MKLLFDENLSPKLAVRLSDLVPGSTHISLVALEGHSDARVWEFAKAQGYIIVSKDNDFRQRAFLYGTPPKVIWLQVGNAGTNAIEALIRHQIKRIIDFINSTEESLLVLNSGTFLD